jgi:hypothetical protein
VLVAGLRIPLGDDREPFRLVLREPTAVAKLGDDRLEQIPTAADLVFDDVDHVRIVVREWHVARAEPTQGVMPPIRA